MWLKKFKGLTTQFTTSESAHAMSQFALYSKPMHFSSVCPSFFPEYVDEVRELVFSMPPAERNAVLSKYKTKTPAPLNSQSTEKRSRVEAVENYNKRKPKEVTPYPSGEVISD